MSTPYFFESVVVFLTANETRGYFHIIGFSSFTRSAFEKGLEVSRMLLSKSRGSDVDFVIDAFWMQCPVRDDIISLCMKYAPHIRFLGLHGISPENQNHLFSQIEKAGRFPRLLSLQAAQEPDSKQVDRSFSIDAPRLSSLELRDISFNSFRTQLADGKMPDLAVTLNSVSMASKFFSDILPNSCKNIVQMNLELTQYMSEKDMSCLPYLKFPQAYQIYILVYSCVEALIIMERFECPRLGRLSFRFQEHGSPFEICPAESHYPHLTYFYVQGPTDSCLKLASILKAPKVENFILDIMRPSKRDYSYQPVTVYGKRVQIAWSSWSEDDETERLPLSKFILPVTTELRLISFNTSEELPQKPAELNCPRLRRVDLIGNSDNFLYYAKGIHPSILSVDLRYLVDTPSWLRDVRAKKGTTFESVKELILMENDQPPHSRSLYVVAFPNIESLTLSKLSDDAEEYLKQVSSLIRQPQPKRSISRLALPHLSRLIVSLKKDIENELLTSYLRYIGVIVQLYHDQKVPLKRVELHLSGRNKLLSDVDDWYTKRVHSFVVTYL